MEYDLNKIIEQIEEKHSETCSPLYGESEIYNSMSDADILHEIAQEMEARRLRIILGKVWRQAK